MARPILKKGSKGPVVRELQQKLAALHFYSKKIDDDYGKGCVEAVKKFQHAHKLPETGTCGPLTWKALDAIQSGPPAPLVKDFHGEAVAKVLAPQKPYSLQIEQGMQVRLVWSTANADGIELTDPASGVQKLAASGSTDVSPADETQEYALVALAGTVRSPPQTVHVSVHMQGEVVSSHSEVFAPATMIGFEIKNESGDSSALSGSVQGEKGKPVAFSFSASEGTSAVEISGGSFNRRFTAAEGEGELTAAETTTYSAVAFDESGGESMPLTATVTVGERKKTQVFLANPERVLKEIDKDWDVGWFNIKAGASLKVGADVRVDLEGSDPPSGAELAERIKAGTAEYSVPLTKLIDDFRHLEWEGEAGVREFRALVTSHNGEEGSGGIAEFTLYKGELAAPGSEEMVEVTVTVAAVSWDGKEGKILVLPVTVEAAFPVIKASIDEGRIECSLEVALEVGASVDTRKVLEEVIGDIAAEVILDVVFEEVLVPLIIIVIAWELVKVFGKADDNSADIKRADVIVNGFKAAYEAQLKACAAGNNTEPGTSEMLLTLQMQMLQQSQGLPEPDGAMAKMVQVQGLRNAWSFFQAGSKAVLANAKMKDWIKKGVAKGKKESALKAQAIDAYNKKITATAGELAAKALVNGYQAIGQAMINFMDPDGLGVYHDQQVAMAEKLDVSPPALSYDVYMANYTKQYTQDRKLMPLEQRGSIPYTQKEWNALPADQKVVDRDRPWSKLYKPNPAYHATHGDIATLPGIGPVQEMGWTSDPSGGEGAERQITAAEYAQQNGGFQAVLIAGSFKAYGQALSINFDASGKFMCPGSYYGRDSDRKDVIFTFEAPAKLDGNDWKQHQPQPPPTHFGNQDVEYKAGIRAWNDPMHMDGDKEIVARRGYRAKMFIQKVQWIGRAAEFGKTDGIFVSDDGNVVIRYDKPAYVKKI